MRRPLVGWLGTALLVSAMGLSTADAQQSPPPQQPPPPPKEDSLAEAARKAKAAKEAREAKEKDKDQKDATKPKAKKVFTDEDMSGLKGSGVSVVGEASGSQEAKDLDAPLEKPQESTPGAPNEAYWRGKARKIRDQMTAVDQQIEKLKEEIKKTGAAGFSNADNPMDPRQNYIWLHDRNAQLKELEKRRADLDAQMDALMEEGRKAGASPGWFR